MHHAFHDRITHCFFALCLCLALTAHIHARDIADDAGPVTEPAEIVSGADMRDFMHQLNRSESNRDSVILIEQFTANHEIDADERPPQPRDAHTIRLRDRTFVPEPGIDPEVAATAAALGPDEMMAAIIQLEHAPSFADYIVLLEADVRGLFHSGWISHTAFIAAFDRKGFEMIENHELVRWIGRYRNIDKMSPDKPHDARALVSPIDTDRPAYRDMMAAVNARLINYHESLDQYLVALDPDDADELAALWWVRSIAFIPEESTEGISEDRVPEKFRPEDSRILAGAMRVWPLLDGSGVLLGMRDTPPDDSHPDFPAGTFQEGSDVGDGVHGTHVAGIILGRDQASNKLSGKYSARGMAPGASVFNSSLHGHAYSTAFDSFLEQNIRLSNHSWGMNALGNYGDHEENFDNYVIDQDALIVKSAGNRSNVRTITRPGDAKNILAVGAIRYLTDDTRTGRGIGGRAAYSSQGPSRNARRLKPDLVAPGGQRSEEQVWFNDQWVWFTKYGVVSMNPIDADHPNTWPEDDNYRRASGTSMAAPHVTGTAAMMLERWPDLKSHEARARLIATTIPIRAGGDDPAAGYANTEVGYGLVNAYNATGYQYGQESQTLTWQSGTMSIWNPVRTKPFNVPMFTERLVAVLAYNDRAGNSGFLVDDLDIELLHGDTVHQVALPDQVTEKSALQKQVVENPASGEWSARVIFNNPTLFATKDYNVMVYAIRRTPQLAITSIDAPEFVVSGQPFHVSMTVENTGGWIAAGVTGRVDAAPMNGDTKFTKNLRNLNYQGDVESVGFDLVAPSWVTGSSQTIDLDFNADLINLGTSAAVETVQVTVVKPGAPIARDVHVTLPPNSDTILIDALANDFNPGEEPLQITMTSSPSCGEASIISNSIQYTVTNRFTCSQLSIIDSLRGMNISPFRDEFEYTISNEYGEATARVFVNDSTRGLMDLVDLPIPRLDLKDLMVNVNREMIFQSGGFPDIESFFANGFGVITPVDPLAGGSHTLIKALAPSGTAVGWSDTEEGIMRAMIWDPEKQTRELAGGQRVRTRALAVSSSGLAVGQIENPDLPGSQAAIWAGGSPQIIPGLPGQSVATAANDETWVAGVANLPTNPADAFGWVNPGIPGDTRPSLVAEALERNGSGFIHNISTGKTTILKTDDVYSFFPRAIGPNGKVVGVFAERGNLESSRAGIWTNESLHDLGTLGGPRSDALAINRHGVVVGTAETPWGQQRGFLWHQDTGMVDINAFIDENMTAISATGITDQGDVTIHAIDESGVPRHFLTSPFLPPLFARWSQQAALANPELTPESLAPTADASGDGIENLLVYVIGGDPLEPGAVYAAPGQIGPGVITRPVIIASEDDDQERLLVFSRLLGADDVETILQISNDLTKWMDARDLFKPYSPPIPSPDGESELVMLRLEPGAMESGAFFVRLKARLRD